MSSSRRCGVLALVCACLSLAACGTSIRHATAQHAAARGTDAAQVEVIRAWAQALRLGHLQAAARFFAEPSVFENGTGPIVLRNQADAVIANASLSCGAQLLSVRPIGRLLHAIFRLTNRPGPGGGCGAGVGQEGATDFLITNGHISHWLRAPINEPSTPTTPTPEAPTGTGQQV